MRHISRSRRRVHALRLLAAARQQEAGEPLVDIGLLVAIEPAGHASPEDPPIDLALHLVAVRQAGGVDAARLLDAEIVAGIAEAGAQAEAAEIEPADFEGRALLAPVGRGRGRRRPSAGWRRAASEFLPSPMVCSSFAGSSSGATGDFAVGEKTAAISSSDAFSACSLTTAAALRSAGFAAPACAARTAAASGCR